MTDKEKKNEKPKIDPKTLSGLGDVKHEKQPSLKKDPKIVSYWLFDEDDSLIRVSSSARGNPTVFKINDIFHPSKSKSKNEENVTFDIYNHVKNYVTQHGSINELWIEGHGSKLIMGDNHNKDFDIMKFLRTMELELGTGSRKIANRIIFGGCSTFEKLTDDEIKKIRNIADKYDIEIVGTTSTTSDSRGRSKNNIYELLKDISEFLGIPARQLDGRYVQFTSRGEVVRDKLDNRWGNHTFFEDRSWIGYHLNHTQEEGHKLRAESEKHDLEVQKFWLNRGKRGTSLGNPD